MRTKELFLMCILTVILISCSIPNNKSYKDVEFYSISNDSMLLKCKDLRGLAGFEIGKTTYSEALKDPNFYGHDNMDSIAVAFVSYYGLPPSSANDNSIIAVDNMTYDEQLYSEYVKMAKLASAKRLHANQYQTKLSQFNNLVLDFYKDTLVCIEYIGNDNVLYLYQSKYGNGRGKHTMYREYNFGPDKTISYIEVDTTNVLYYNKDVIVNVFERYDRISKDWYHHVVITDKHGKYKEYCSKVRNALKILKDQEKMKSNQNEKERINQV